MMAEDGEDKPRQMTEPPKESRVSSNAQMAMGEAADGRIDSAAEGIGGLI